MSEAFYLPLDDAGLSMLLPLGLLALAFGASLVGLGRRRAVVRG